MIAEKICPVIIVAIANFLLPGDEGIISDSAVVKPAFVNKDITWKRAFSCVKPVSLNAVVKISTRTM